jgi:hypothetical protein
MRSDALLKTWSQNLRVCHCVTCRSWSSIVGSRGEDDAAAAGRRPALGADRTPDPVPTSDRLHQLVLDELSNIDELDWTRGCIDAVSVRSKRGRADRPQPH